MCGVVGYVVLKNHRKYSDDLKKAIAALVHRGPDNQSSWENKVAGLGHTRLSILDLSSSADQPMVSYNGRYVISFNGQVYNYIELANKLKTTFELSSDTRVMLETISELGIEKAVTFFNGMFAFALWDNCEEKLYLVRDSMGIKMLYWAYTIDGYVFGSEIKSLKAFSEFKTNVCIKGLQSYFDNKAIYAPYSIYENCYKLLPGHILVIHKNKFTINKFVPIVQNYSHIRTVQDADECFEYLLTDSIKRHSRSDVPFCAFLSGGIDSSLIVSFLSKHHSFKTYSVGYEEKDFDESKKAQKIAAAIGVEHNIIVLSPETVFSEINNIVEIYDEPFADSSCLPTYLLSKEVSKYAKIAFSGDGADELFAGYPRYFNAINQWNKIGFIPYFIRNKILKNIIPNNSKLLNLFASFFLKDPQQSLPYLKTICGHKTMFDLFYSDNFLGVPLSTFSTNYQMINASSFSTIKFNGSASSLKCLLSYDQQFRLPDEMLTKVDRASMANSLEIRVPFLDNDIVAFSRSVSDALLGTNNIQKILLKKLLSKYIPHSLFDGPKVGFHIPMKIWLKTHYKKWAEHLLFGTKITDSIFNIIELKKMWYLYCNGDAQLFYPLWSIIMYNQWAIKHYRNL